MRLLTPILLLSLLASCGESDREIGVECGEVSSYGSTVLFPSDVDRARRAHDVVSGVVDSIEYEHCSETSTLRCTFSRLTVVESLHDSPEVITVRTRGGISPSGIGIQVSGEATPHLCDRPVVFLRTYPTADFFDVVDGDSGYRTFVNGGEYLALLTAALQDPEFDLSSGVIDQPFRRKANTRHDR